MSAEVQQLHGGGAPLREVMLGAESGLQPGSSFWTWARCLCPNMNLRPQPTRPQLLRAALEGEWERGDAHAIAGHHSTRHYWGSQGAERSVLSPPPPRSRPPLCRACDVSTQRFRRRGGQWSSLWPPPPFCWCAQGGRGARSPFFSVVSDGGGPLLRVLFFFLFPFFLSLFSVSRGAEAEEFGGGAAPPQGRGSVDSSVRGAVRCGGRGCAGPAALLWGFVYCGAGESGSGLEHGGRRSWARSPRPDAGRGPPVWPRARRGGLRPSRRSGAVTSPGARPCQVGGGGRWESAACAEPAGCGLHGSVWRNGGWGRPVGCVGAARCIGTRMFVSAVSIT